MYFEGAQSICVYPRLFTAQSISCEGSAAGGWSTVNHCCYSTDYTAGPSICLTPSLTPLHPPTMHKKFSLYIFVCIPLSARPPLHSLSLTYKSLHTCCLSCWEMLMIATSPPPYFISMSACRKALGRRVKNEEEMHWRLWPEGSKFYYSLGAWGIQQASLHLFIYPTRQPSLHTRTFPAEIDLHSLICLLLQQLSCCWEEGGGCSQTGWHGPMSSCSW